MIRPPKPRPFPRSKPAPLPKRDAVTIVAGFKCYEGVVLCADTQETVLHSKRHVPKLRFEPDHIVNWGKALRGEDVTDLAAAFCGAGDGPFIDKLIDEAWKTAQKSTSLQEAGERIEASIKGLYREFGKIYQPGCCPQVDLIYGVKMGGRTELFSAVGPVVNEKGEYYSAGQGYYMADFLARRMYGDHLTIHQAVIVAAYTLFQAKEHVDGCGGDSQIAVLRDSGPSGLLNFQVINAIRKTWKWQTSISAVSFSPQRTLTSTTRNGKKQQSIISTCWKSFGKIKSRILTSSRKAAFILQQCWELQTGKQTN